MFIYTIFCTNNIWASENYKCIYFSFGASVAECTVNGVVFEKKDNTLYAKKNSKSYVVKDNYDGISILTDGNTVYLNSSTNNGGESLYKVQIGSNSVKYIGKLDNSYHYNRSCVLRGYYNNTFYYTVGDLYNVGPFCKYDLLNNNNTKLVDNISDIKQLGPYFVLDNYTGAGTTYLGIWDANQDKAFTIANNSYKWEIASKYVYYAEVREGSPYDYRNIKTVDIIRFSLSEKKRKTIVKSFKLKSIYKMSNGSIEYCSISDKTKTRKYTELDDPAYSDIILNFSSASILKGSTKKLQAIIDGKSQKIVWTSSNTSVAKVRSDGSVTGIKAGTATITAKANGKTAKCKITVIARLDLSKYINKSFSVALKELEMKHVPGKDREIPFFIDFGKYLDGKDQYYTKTGSFSNSTTYLVGHSAVRKENGKWGFTIRDKQYSFYGITKGTSATTANTKMLNNGWRKVWEGANARHYTKGLAYVIIKNSGGKTTEIHYLWEMESEFA